jgi:hypothetical protein
MERTRETRRAMKNSVTAKRAEEMGVTLASGRRIGNVFLYPVLKDGREVGAVWCWKPVRGRRPDWRDESAWRWGYARPEATEPRPLTLWRGQVGTGAMYALYAEDGEPFETRTLAALAVAQRGGIKATRERVKAS